MNHCTAVRPGDRSARIASIPARLWSKIRHERKCRRTIAALEALDDQTLKDIGVLRYDIEQDVRHRLALVQSQVLTFSRAVAEEKVDAEAHAS
jgi:uncharacterized protein YjiS (DUF1127 family)